MSRLTNVLVAFSLLINGQLSVAQTSVVAREVMDFWIKKFGKESLEYGIDKLTKKTGVLVKKYGDEAIVAVKECGPRSFKYIEEAGDLGAGHVVKMMAKHGDKSLHVLTKPNRLAIFLKHGDDAGEAMVKYGEFCDPLITQFGPPAVKAFAKASDSQMARKIALIAGEEGLKKNTPELFDTIGKYGGKATDFIWKNKGALATAATLTAFLADPEPFIDGARALVAPAMDNITSLPKVAVEKGAEAVANKTNFTLLGVIGILSIVGIVGLRMFLKSPGRESKQQV